MCFLCCRLSGSFGFTRPFGKKAILCQEPTNQQCSTISYVIFFFLHGSTTLYRVLPFSTNFSFHPLLSCVRVFQFGTLSFCISFRISSIQRAFRSSYRPAWNGIPGAYCFYHSRTLPPFNVTEPAQSLCSDEIYYILMFYYFIQLLISFYSPYAFFVDWAKYLS